MLVKLTTSLAGADFSLHYGQVIDLDELVALVGEGGRDLSIPVETAAAPPPEETASTGLEIETAVHVPVTEIATKRGRRK